MPMTPMRNLLYRAALPFAAPSPHKQMKHAEAGHPLVHLPYYEHLLVKHHVLGASLYLQCGGREAAVYTSVYSPRHLCGENTMFRVASITKMATAVVTLMCVDEGLFTLDTPIAQLLPETEHAAVLAGMTVRHVLSHTSGLRDTPALDDSLRKGLPFDVVLASPGVRQSEPGSEMAYCNFGFGLLGCMLEHMTGLDLETLFRTRLFEPLGMRAAMDATTLREEDIMPISRVLPYRKGTDVTITKLGRNPLREPDPLHRYGHTAGAMYTDAASVARLLRFIAGDGTNAEGRRLLSEALLGEMRTRHASTATRVYGLGLVLLDRPGISDRRLIGHQGFAYGCVDGAFIEEGTGNVVVFLNGGASEARNGRLGLVNQDVLTWAFRKEFPAWT